MEKHTYQSHTYYTKGANPRILIFSGMHGNEYESGRILTSYLTENAHNLPDFVYIPEVSPSAVTQGTRKNTHGHDINREFLNQTTDQEALAVMYIVKPYTFHLCIDIHEDPDRTMSCYIYDTAHMTPEELQAYRACIQTTDARLYTGIDDVDDEHLMLQVDKGYVSLGYEESHETAGFSSRWLYETGIAKRTFTVEIPGKAHTSLKNSIIRALTPYLLARYHSV